MTRDEAQAILHKHNPLIDKGQDEALVTAYRKWLVDAMLEAVELEREACAATAEQATHRARQAAGWGNAHPVKPCEIAAAIRSRSLTGN